MIFIKTIISPAKNMKLLENMIKPLDYINPKTKELYSILKNFTSDDIYVYMKVNSEIALKTFTYYNNMNLNSNGTPAIFTYNGIQYKNIGVETFNTDDIKFASENIKIISAFYGVLNADTPIQPYRLEMGAKINGIPNLYEFWKNDIYNNIFKYNEPVINIASNEYSKTIYPFLKPNDIFINIKFMKFSKGKYKVFATDSKILRGKMVNFIVKNKIKNVSDLKYFESNDYQFIEKISDDKNFIFYKS